MIRRFSGASAQATTQIPPSPFTRVLFFDTRLAWLWLVVRLLVGYQWLSAGWAKMTGISISFDSFGQAAHGGPWIASGHDGVALAGFIQGAVAKANGPFPAVQGWYAAFLSHVILPNVAFLAYVVTFGEVLVGLGLIAGAFTGIAAFFGLFMNLNYVLAGAVSINPPLAIGALFLVLAWRVCGYYGADHYLLPLLGTPWTGPLAPSKVVLTAQPAQTNLTN